MALLIGFVLVSDLGIAHHNGLRALRAMKPSLNGRPQAAIMVAFLGLLALHTIEILAFAAAYRMLLSWRALGNLGGSFDATRNGLSTSPASTSRRWGTRKLRRAAR